MSAEAIRLAELGFHMVPWSRRSPTKQATKPLITEYHTKRSPDHVRAWARMFGEIDWAVIPQQHAVLDLEMKNGLDGVRGLRELGYDAFDHRGPITRTKTGGYHLWFRMPSGVSLKGGHYIGHGVEAKAITGSVHVPPSYGYTAQRPIEWDAPELPTPLAEQWQKTVPAKKMSATYDLRVIHRGCRRDFLNSTAGKLRECFACNADEIAAILRVLADSRCEGPDEVLDEHLQKIAKYMARREIRSQEGLAHTMDPLSATIEEWSK